MTRATLLAFYIFKGERMWEDYIKLCRMGNMHDHVKKNLNNCISLRGVIFFQFICHGGDFALELSFFDSRWAWVTYNSQ
jgi:hypothetical protein